MDEVIVAGDIRDRQLLGIVETAHRAGVQVLVAPSVTELLIQRAEYVPGQGLPLFEFRPPVFAGSDWFVKRTFDYVVASAVVVVGSPLWLLIAAAVKLTSSGPVFYRDRRIGVNEREFGMIKFRTMYQDADAHVGELEQANEAEGALFKIRRDPRVTPVGRLLRRLSIDEVPQVLNVLRGEMSLVGPRPLPLRDYALLDRVAPQALPRPARDDGTLADLRPLEPRLRRPGAARLLLPRELVDLDGHLHPAQDHPRGALRPRRLLIRAGPSPAPRP